MERKDRVIMDCRDKPETNCSLTISGTEEEVLELGEYHVTARHGMSKGPETREQLRSFLKRESYAR